MSRKPDPQADRPTPLPDHLAWLESIGAKPCSCRYAWKPLSWREPGPGRVTRSMGYGWVRMNTDPRCPEHGHEIEPGTRGGVLGVAVDEWGESRAKTVKPDPRYL
jgi:hypothetical protein